MEKMIDVNPVFARIIHKLLGSKLIFILQIRQTFFQFNFLPVNVTDICISPWGDWKQKKWPADLGTKGRQERVTSKSSLIERWRFEEGRERNLKRELEKLALE